MAVKMVREPSETPNINNIDDIVPFRYAYGGQNGYVLKKGSEISHTIKGLDFTINSGRLVLQGVECDIDALGVSMTVDNLTMKKYYTVYLSVNLALNKAEIKYKVDSADYPVVEKGDDLTEFSSGIANMVLYKFTAQNGAINDVQKVIKGISYPLNDYDSSKGSIEQRLTSLGFKQGAVESLVGTASENYLKRQGNYVIGKLNIDKIEWSKILKSEQIGIIPEQFRPTQDLLITMSLQKTSRNFYPVNYMVFYAWGLFQIIIESTTGIVKINKNYLDGYKAESSLQSQSSYTVSSINNISKISDYTSYHTLIQFGYEAKPL